MCFNLHRADSSVAHTPCPPPFSLKRALCNFFKKETPPSGEEHYLLPVRTDSYLGSGSMPAPCPQGAMMERGGRGPLGGEWFSRKGSGELRAWGLDVYKSGLFQPKTLPCLPPVCPLEMPEKWHQGGQSGRLVVGSV